MEYYLEYFFPGACYDTVVSKLSPDRQSFFTLFDMKGYHTHTHMHKRTNAESLWSPLPPFSSCLSQDGSGAHPESCCDTGCCGWSAYTSHSSTPSHTNYPLLPVKLPQIVKILRARSVENLSFLANMQELAAVTFTSSYSYAKGFPFR